MFVYLFWMFYSCECYSCRHRVCNLHFHYSNSDVFHTHSLFVFHTYMLQVRQQKYNTRSQHCNGHRVLVSVDVEMRFVHSSNNRGECKCFRCCLLIRVKENVSMCCLLICVKENVSMCCLLICVKENVSMCCVISLHLFDFLVKGSSVRMWNVRILTRHWRFVLIVFILILSFCRSIGTRIDVIAYVECACTEVVWSTGARQVCTFGRWTCQCSFVTNCMVCCHFYYCVSICTGMKYKWATLLPWTRPFIYTHVKRMVCISCEQIHSFIPEHQGDFVFHFFVFSHFLQQQTFLALI
jgi:hypothetical protein